MARRTRAIEQVVRDQRTVDFQFLDNRDDDSDRTQWALCYASEIIRREVAANTWEAFWSTAVANLPPSDVARQLGMKIGAVYTAKCRVLARIRELSEELLEVEDEF
jgi:RNA polymerase sigma-70 factor (ECF subfamily)